VEKRKKGEGMEEAEEKERVISSRGLDVQGMIAWLLGKEEKAKVLVLRLRDGNYP
jgi:hypothetical protein